MSDERLARTLYLRGWRQASLVTARLEVSSLCDEAGSVEGVTAAHERWVVASQDCDLANVHEDDVQPVIELRPVRTGNPNADWGIRSKILRLSDHFYVEASAPRLLVSPRVLTGLEAHREDQVDPYRAQAFKTWLGLRYDRPAVPPEYGELATAIAEAVRQTRSATLAAETHDVLMQFSGHSLPRFVLVAVMVDLGDSEGIVEWLAKAALQVAPQLGVLAEPPIAVTKSRLSLQFLEESYAADLSAITWTKRSPTDVS